MSEMTEFEKQQAIRKTIFNGIEALIEDCHGASVNAGWYTDIATGLPKVRNDGEQMMLMVSEIAEAMEGNRKGLRDDKLPHRMMEEVELADLIIRVADYAGKKKLDLAGAILEKRTYNDSRADHKIENRKLEGGKAY